MDAHTVNELKFVRGTVRMASPQWGAMVVSDETHATNGAAKTFVAYMCASPTRYGAGPKFAYPPGTTVICALSPESDNVGYVLCAVNDITKKVEEGILQWAPWLLNVVQPSLLCQWTGISRLVPPSSRNYVSNRGVTMGPGVFPGDYIVSDNSGTVGMTLSRYLMQLKASALTYMEMSAADNRILTFANSLSDNTPLTETFNGLGLYGHNTAISFIEALGLDKETGNNLTPGDGEFLADKLQTKSDNRYEQKYKTLPYFRLQELEGLAVQGRERLVTWLDPDKQHTVDEAPLVLSKRRDDISGELDDVSAFGFMALKSPDIKGILQRGYGREVYPEYADRDSRSPALRTPYQPDEQDEDGFVALDSETLSRDMPLNMFARNDRGGASLGAPYHSGMINDPESTYSDGYAKQIRAAAGVGAGTDTLYSKKMKEAANFKDMQAPYGSFTGEAYPFPQTLVLTDPVTGTTRQYFATESFITQQPNGDILLSDGYGSEIRMSRGNIYISPALDCHIRPGRDMSVMAGRYQSYNAQNTTTLSTVGGMYIKASKDLKIAGALSQKERVNSYAVTLESGAAPNSTGGVVIRSNSGISMTSNDIYIGRNLNTGTSETSVTYPEQPGSIVIDCGRANGSFSVNAKESLIYGERITLLSQMGNTGANVAMGARKPSTTTSGSNRTGAIVGAGGAWMIAGSLLECPMNISIGKLKTENSNYTVDVPTAFNEEGKVTVKTTPKDPGCIIHLQGELYTTGNVMTNGWGLFRTGVYGKHMASQNMAGRLGYIKPDNRIWDPWTFQQMPALEGMGAYASALVNRMSSTIYNDAFISRKGFCFPNYNVSPQMIVPGMRWQYMSNESDNEVGDQGVWHEEYIPDPNAPDTLTACYPGYQAWTEARISKPGWIEGMFENEYVINTTEAENGTEKKVPEGKHVSN